MSKFINAEFVKSSADWQNCPDRHIPEYAFIGRSNVGKSSLINALTNRKALAKISGTPGKTQLINTFLIEDNWYLTDLPGYGYAKVSKKDRKKFSKLITEYIVNRKNLVNLYVLVDSRIPLQNNDKEFMDFLGRKRIPFSIVFTKIDKLSASVLQKNILKYQKQLLSHWQALPPMHKTSATAKVGLESLQLEINRTNDQLRKEGVF